jgi:hypothetical protein
MDFWINGLMRKVEAELNKLNQEAGGWDEQR